MHRSQILFKFQHFQTIGTEKRRYSTTYQWILKWIMNVSETLGTPKTLQIVGTLWSVEILIMLEILGTKQHAATLKVISTGASCYSIHIITLCLYNSWVCSVLVVVLPLYLPPSSSTHTYIAMYTCDYRTIHVCTKGNNYSCMYPPNLSTVVDKCV